MRYRFHAALLAGALLTCSSASVADVPADTVTYLEEAVANGIYVGGIVALVEGEEVSVHPFGVASKETGETPDSNTVFEIGSITKTVTGTLLASEVLAGQIRLEDPVQRYLPPGIALSQVGARPVTIEDLATHRSGLPRTPANLAPADAADPFADFDEAKLWEAVRTVVPAREPGVAHEYSNFAYGLLGSLLARNAGTTYRELAARRIFRPLGMNNSDTLLTDAARPRVAQGYDADGKPVPHWTFAALAGAGAVYSTMSDMLIYLRANMAAAAKAGTSTPLREAMALALEPRADTDGGRIGLGWFSPPGGNSFAHDGSTYGFSSFIAFTADGRRGVVVLANTLALETTTTIGVHLINPAVPLPPLTVQIALTPDMLAQYQGAYALAPNIAVTVVARGAGIETELPGQPPIPLAASAPDRFFHKSLPMRIRFDRNDNNQVVRMVIQQAGQRFRAPRLGTDGNPVSQPQRLAFAGPQLEAFVGVYSFGPQRTLTITRENDSLMALMNGQPAPVPIFSEQADHFEFETLDIDLDFERDEGGSVTAVRLNSGQAQMRGSKLSLDEAPPAAQVGETTGDS